MENRDAELEAIRKQRAEAAKSAAQKAGSIPEVIIYTSSSCHYCNMAKEYLSARRISFTEYDVTSDQARAKEMVAKSRQGGVPVLEINGRIVVGFDRQLIDDALKRAKPPKRDTVMQNLSFDLFER